MSYSPNVTFDIVYHPSKEELKKQKDVCFGYWFTQLMPQDEITFYCEISSKLKREESEYFVKFIKRLTGGKRFFEIIEFTDTLLKVKITRGKNFVSSRLWLTLFRFLQEFPEVVAEFHKEKKVKHTIDNQIKIFFDLNNSRAPKLNYNNLQGHGIGLGYFDRNIKKVTTFKKFKERIKNEDIRSVSLAFVE